MIAPRGEKRKALFVQLSIPDRQRIDELCASEGLTISDLIRVMVRAYSPGSIDKRITTLEADLMQIKDHLHDIEARST